MSNLVGINVVVSREFQDAFNRELKEGTKRTIQEGVNTHIYYIGRAALVLTESTTKEKIRSELLSPRKGGNGSTLADRIVQKQRREKGLPGLEGEKMAEATEKFIKRRENTRNYLRAGWLPAIKKMAPYTKGKAGAMARPANVRLRKSGTKGGASPASLNWFPRAEIWNAINGAKNKPNKNIKAKINKGAEDAIRHEAAHINERLDKKIQERIEKFNAR